jgi:hypothetical protein
MSKRRVTKLTDAELVNLWYSDLSIPILQRQHKIRYLPNIWEKLREKGLLPRWQRRRATTIIKNGQYVPKGRHVEYHCLVCQKPFMDRYSTDPKRHRKYCSPKCQHKDYQDKHPMTLERRKFLSDRQLKPLRTSICGHCGKDFVVPRDTPAIRRDGKPRKTSIRPSGMQQRRKYCSKACFTAGMSIRHQEYWTPEKREQAKADAIRKNHIRWSDPNARAKWGAMIRALWADPKYRQKVQQGWTQESRERISLQTSARNHIRWSDPNARKQWGTFIQERTQRIITLAQIGRAILKLTGEKLWNDDTPYVIKAMPEAGSNPLWFWQEPSYRVDVKETRRRRFVLAKAAEQLMTQYGVQL